MNQEDLLFMAELTRLAKRPDAVKHFATDKELIDRIVDIRRKYGVKQYAELVKQATEV